MQIIFCGQFPEPKESVIHVFYALKCLPSRGLFVTSNSYSTRTTAELCKLDTCRSLILTIQQI